MFSTPFTTEAGKAHANDVTKQQRRNTIMTVKYPFPCLLTRQPVQSIEQVGNIRLCFFIMEECA